MKRVLFHALLTAVMAAAVFCSPLQESFARANRLYEDGKYSEALQIYRQMLSACQNWKVEYNAGNTCYKLGRYLEAKIHYLKARKLKPLLAMIETNIQVVNRQFRDKIPPAKTDFLTDLYLRLETWISDSFLLVLLIILSLGANLFLFLFIRGKRSRTVLYGMIVSILCFSLLFGYQWLRLNRRQGTTTAVVTRESAELRSGPGQRNTVLFKVNPGLELRILDRIQDWYQVSASSQIAGWIEASALEVI